MAKNYRTILYDQTLQLGTVSLPIKACDIEPIDSQQSLGSYLSNVKVSVITETIYHNPVSFMVFASSDNTSLGIADVITAGATGAGGGTVNLSLKRNIRDSDDDPSRSDGPVSIWIQPSRDMNNEQEDQNCTFVVEAWGRFIEVTQ